MRIKEKSPMKSAESSVPTTMVSDGEPKFDALVKSSPESKRNSLPSSFDANLTQLKSQLGKTMPTSLSSENSTIVPFDHHSSCGLFFKQLIVMLWKSMIVRRVHFISTFFELLGPILVVLVGAWLFSRLVEEKLKNNTTMVSENNEPVLVPTTYYHKMGIFNNLDSFKNDSMKVWYSPHDGSNHVLFDSLESLYKVNVTGVSDEETMVTQINAYLNDSNEDSLNVLAVNIQHLDLSKAQVKLKIYVPCHKDVLFSWRNRYPDKGVQGPVNWDLSDKVFATLSPVLAHIGYDFIRKLNSSNTKPPITAIELGRMPFPEYRQTQSLSMRVFNLLALYLVLSYLVLSPLMVKRITDEKSTNSKELLRMMGMSDLVFWSSHFISYLIPIVVQSLGITAILFSFPNPVLTYCSKSLFICILIIFGIQLIFFSMLIATVFNRPIVAVMITGILWLVLAAMGFHFLVPGNGNDFDVSATNFARMLTSALPTSSLFWMVSIIGCFESLNRAITWNNYNETTSTYHEFTASRVAMTIFISYPIYIFLIWYLDNVWPFQVGLPKSPLFFLQLSYWYPERSKIAVKRPKLNNAIYEIDPVSLKPSIELYDVCKMYRRSGTMKYAVDHLWFNIYHNQITVLLGHNGAGKTTTMSMITGLIQSTSGDIYVNGFNVFTQTKQARRSIGLCPQENIIFNELTVYQHIKFFAILKDYPYNQVNQEVEKIIGLLKLNDKRNELASSLSGGMKRKLALGMALVGDTKILILDEPTSGMDPEARRVIWDLLISIRRQRTILLTTHYMEEADVLGDRIAIMNDGKLCCSGSPFFLKNTFGTGYQLRVEKKPKFNRHSFINVLQKYVPTTTLKSEIETEAIYNFNIKASDKEILVNVFPEMFTDLEANRKWYRINSFGLSYSTLEDVFLSVGSDSLANTDAARGANRKNNEDTRNQAFLLTKNTQLLTGSKLFWNQLKILFIKRVNFAKRYWTMLILQLIVPSIIIFIAMKLDHAIRMHVKGQVEMINLNLSKMYGEQTRAFYSGPQDLADEYVALNRDKYGAIVHVLNECINSDKGNFADCLLSTEGSPNLALYSRKYVTGLEVEKDSYTMWYNTEQSLSLPLSMMNAFEAMARRVINSNSGKQDVSFQMNLKPLLVTLKERYEKRAYKLFITWIITCLIFLPIAFPFIAASYVLFPIREQVTKCKLLQLMTGVSPTLFWISNFIFDFLYHLISIVLLCIFIFIFDSDRIFFSNDSKVTGPVLFIILMAFGFGSIPVAYIASYYFKTPTGGFVFLLITSLFIGIPVNAVISVLELVNTLGHRIFPQYVYILYLLRLIPIFSMVFGYQKLYLSMTLAKLCAMVTPIELARLCFVASEGDESYMFIGCCPAKCADNCYGQGSAFSSGLGGCGTEVFFLLFVGVFLMLLIILFETYTLKVLKFFSGLKRSPRVATPQDVSIEKSCTSLRAHPSGSVREDSDVLEEKIRIDRFLESGEVLNEALKDATRRDSLSSASVSTQTSPDLLLIHELTKCYGDFMAVDHLTFGVHFHECFGLLGVNGAGKTTTFSMLTGDLLPTSGDAFLYSGYSLMHSLRHFRKNVGYCPQFDALIDQLTGEETLYLFAQLRGVPHCYQKRDVDNLIKMVGLEKHATKQCGAYSGGNRRKLSIAVALIGNPPLIFLDEPSAGVDPGARRKIWGTLGAVKSNFNSSIILTSHSMEECEALCSRIAIMVSGRFRCLGSTQHLRAKYGQGYSILIRLHRYHEIDDKYSDLVESKLCQVIPSAVLRDSHQCLMNFQVTDKSETWSNIFKHMAELDRTFKFEDYVVSDTTLENIFIMFARNQQNQANGLWLKESNGKYKK